MIRLTESARRSLRSKGIDTEALSTAQLRDLDANRDGQVTQAEAERPGAANDLPKAKKPDPSSRRRHASNPDAARVKNKVQSKAPRSVEAAAPKRPSNDTGGRALELFDMAKTRLKQGQDIERHRREIVDIMLQDPKGSIDFLSRSGNLSQVMRLVLFGGASKTDDVRTSGALDRLFNAVKDDPEALARMTFATKQAIADELRSRVPNEVAVETMKSIPVPGAGGIIQYLVQDEQRTNDRTVSDLAQPFLNRLLAESSLYLNGDCGQRDANKYNNRYSGAATDHDRYGGATY